MNKDAPAFPQKLINLVQGKLEGQGLTKRELFILVEKLAGIEASLVSLTNMYRKEYLSLEEHTALINQARFEELNAIMTQMKEFHGKPLGVGFMAMYDGLTMRLEDLKEAAIQKDKII